MMKVKRKRNIKFTDADIKQNQDGLMTGRQRWRVFQHVVHLFLLVGSISYLPLILVVFLCFWTSETDMRNAIIMGLILPLAAFSVFALWFLWILAFKNIISDYYHGLVEVAIGYPKKNNDTVVYFDEQRVEFLHKEGNILDEDTRYRVYYLMKSELGISFEALSSKAKNSDDIK